MAVVREQLLHFHQSNPKRRHRGRVLVIGHLFLDHLVDMETGRSLARPKPGGTAYNAAKAFAACGFSPVLVGRIGKDKDGAELTAILRRQRFEAIVGEDAERPTGRCYVQLARSGTDADRLVVNRNNANASGLEFLQAALARLDLANGDLAFVAAHFLVSHTADESRALFDMLTARGLIVILDLVPHSIDRHLDADRLATIIRDRVTVMISELQTLRRLIGDCSVSRRLARKVLMQRFPVRILVVRFGFDNISRQIVFKRLQTSRSAPLDIRMDTGFSRAPLARRRGFGDRLTADFLARFLPEVRGADE